MKKVTTYLNVRKISNFDKDGPSFSELCTSNFCLPREQMMERAAPWNLVYPNDWEECESKSTSVSPDLPIYGRFTAEIKLIWRSAQPGSPSVNKCPVTKWNCPDCSDTFYNTINGRTETHQGNKSGLLWPKENLANMYQGYEVLQNSIKICK